MPARISLQVPDKTLLDAYQAALRGGWSPNTTRNVAPQQLAAIAADPDAFLAETRGGPGRIRLVEARSAALSAWVGHRPGRLHHLAFALTDPASVRGATASDQASASTGGAPFEVPPEANLGVRLGLHLPA